MGAQVAGDSDASGGQRDQKGRVVTQIICLTTNDGKIDGRAEANEPTRKKCRTSIIGSRLRTDELVGGVFPSVYLYSESASFGRVSFADPQGVLIRKRFALQLTYFDWLAGCRGLC